VIVGPRAKEREGERELRANCGGVTHPRSKEKKILTRTLSDALNLIGTKIGLARGGRRGRDFPIGKGLRQRGVESRADEGQRSLRCRQTYTPTTRGDAVDESLGRYSVEFGIYVHILHRCFDKIPTCLLPGPAQLKPAVKISGIFARKNLQRKRWDATGNPSSLSHSAEANRPRFTMM
jgi:hypothetical protein